MTQDKGLGLQHLVCTHLIFQQHLLIPIPLQIRYGNRLNTMGSTNMGDIPLPLLHWYPLFSALHKYIIREQTPTIAPQDLLGTHDPIHRFRDILDVLFDIPVYLLQDTRPLMCNLVADTEKYCSRTVLRPCFCLSWRVLGRPFSAFGNLEVLVCFGEDLLAEFVGQTEETGWWGLRR